ncbi:SRPBCC family protein [Gordonia polyisoprenivorans]|uniref:SRPBCC family protein n=1 Tax=Gordonia polyisoprenivorans TaxID=84595 RepID=UPI001AD6B079|nr:SRPBCC family protein [Gordonia polyisoprenivorans]QTI69234.1 SRPBCC family protein [Gordonia polyisoprenivorans]
MRSRHVSHVIAAAPEHVYEFASDPGNLALWASGLAQAPVTRRGDDLVVESPMGTVTVRFVPHNEFGVIDHDVTLPSGSTVTNPVRVLAHPDGSEVVFILRQLDLTDEEFDRDAATVAADLARLADLVEQSGPKSG